MLNFRFHIVSLVAVFLALAIGIIMGSTVIDRALVDTLEDQQQSLRADLDDLSAENRTLSDDLAELRRGDDLLAQQGSARLLQGALDDVPVLVVAVRGIDTGALDGFSDLLATAGATDQGTVWLTERLALDDPDELSDLAAILDERGPAEELRALAIEAVADALATGAAEAATPPGDGAVDPEEGEPEEGVPGEGEPEEGVPGEGAPVEGAPGGGATPEGGAPGPEESPSEDAAPVEGQPGGGTGGGAAPEGEGAGDDALDLLVALRDGGFVDVDPPEGASDDLSALVVAGTRVVVVSGPGADVADELAAAPLAVALAQGGGAGEPVGVLAAQGARPDGDDGGDVDDRLGWDGSVVALVRDGAETDRLSTIDNLQDFAGRLAAIVALQDLGDGRTGHYGTGPGAERLVPAPPG